MERKDKIFWAALILFIAAIFLVVSLNLATISSFIKNSLGVYGYVAIFILSMIFEGFDQPIGSDTIAGFGVILGMNAYLVIIFCVISSWLSSSINFYIGRKYLSRKIEQSCSTKGKYFRYCKLFGKYGKYTLLFGALAFPYVIFIYLAGAFGMQYKTFFVYALLSRVIRIVIVVFLALGLISLHFIPGLP